MEIHTILNNKSDISENHKYNHKFQNVLFIFSDENGQAEAVPTKTQFIQSTIYCIRQHKINRKALCSSIISFHENT